MYSPRKLRRSASIQQMMSPVHAYSDFHIALPLPEPVPVSGSTDASATTRAPAAGRDRGGVVGGTVVEHDDLGRRSRAAPPRRRWPRWSPPRYTPAGTRTPPEAPTAMGQATGRADERRLVWRRGGSPGPDILSVNALIESGRGTGPLTPRQPAKTPGTARGRARCQCLTDEQPKNGPRNVGVARGARSASSQTRRRSDGPCSGLRCRECGREYDAAPIFTCEWCFGPLEVAYDYDAITVGHAREDRGRSAQPLALLRPAAGRARPRGRSRHRASRRSCAPIGSRPSSASARCGSRTTRATRRTRSRTASSRSR